VSRAAKPKTFRDPTFECACGVTVTRTSPNQKWCSECRAERNRECNRKYRTSNAAGVNRRKRYAERRELIRVRRKAAYDAAPERHREYHRIWRQANKAKLSLQAKCRAFGMTMDELLDLVERQGYACPVCARPLALDEPFTVDHCHNTQRVRGAVHKKCNTGMGMFADDPATCIRAAAHLLGLDPSVLLAPEFHSIVGIEDRPAGAAIPE
jgi:hypothetical protein